MNGQNMMNIDTQTENAYQIEELYVKKDNVYTATIYRGMNRKQDQHSWCLN